ncbi:flagellar biosynthesis protein FlhB [Bacillus carboniphilus]|uniref:Flagellar biosynthetic protein FlhB n=1 Tax=Bacillus carboniphilus TaxID=86663 RepID=A0ABY9JVW8_9BACI|nr:flagellar biosynthesis protein FlhB [Bacillus carboniphilus]WLR43525.1 flagellar biosynthesis protein FlhB [Bacillus carboniphilus]
MKLLKIDLQFFNGEKTEKATPRKKQDVRKKGQVAKSADLNTAFNLIFVFISFLFIGGFLRDNLTSMFAYSFEHNLSTTLTEETIQQVFIEYTMRAVYIVGPVMLVSFIAGIFSNYLQVGFLFSTEAIGIKLERIDPIKGFKRIYSIRAIVELVKSLLKIMVVGGTAFFVIYYHWPEIVRLPLVSVPNSFQFIAKLTAQVGLYTAFSLLFVAILDYLYQRYDFEKNIRMSKQDLKDEHKKTEGDPLIKSKVKQKQKEMAMGRMMAEVPTADVIITNPTHYAIALKYDQSANDAPLVVAKGIDFIALKIKDIAKEHDIVTLENRLLARSLYHQVEIGTAIPEEFFQAVAEIIAYVYQLKGKK